MGEETKIGELKTRVFTLSGSRGVLPSLLHSGWGVLLSGWSTTDVPVSEKHLRQQPERRRVCFGSESPSFSS